MRRCKADVAAAAADVVSRTIELATGTAPDAAAVRAAPSTRLDGVAGVSIMIVRAVRRCAGRTRRQRPGRTPRAGSGPSEAELIYGTIASLIIFALLWKFAGPAIEEGDGRLAPNGSRSSSTPPRPAQAEAPPRRPSIRQAARRHRRRAPAPVRRRPTPQAETMLARRTGPARTGGRRPRSTRRRRHRGQLGPRQRRAARRDLPPRERGDRAAARPTA